MARCTVYGYHSILSRVIDAHRTSDNHAGYTYTIVRHMQGYNGIKCGKAMAIGYMPHARCNMLQPTAYSLQPTAYMLQASVTSHIKQGGRELAQKNGFIQKITTWFFLT